MDTKPEHIPVLLKEVLLQFSPQAEDVLLDATLGHGGHARAYLEANESTRVIGLDADEQAIQVAQKILAPWSGRVTFIHSNFAQMAQVVAQEEKVTHILFDLGIGSHQIADSKRGFTFQGAGALTMRYGQQEELPPSKIHALNMLERRIGYLPDVTDVLQGLDEYQLATIIKTYGEEKMARRIAAALKSEVIPTTAQELSDSIVAAVPKGYERGRIHPATRTFQALRMAVNRELEVIEAVLPQAVALLEPGGKIAVISFHSLEDRIVKRFFRQQARTCICPPEQPICTCDYKPSLKIETKKPIVAAEGEVVTNARSRSAKLRVATKLPP
ncbi:MAG: 16S rRNA (cytosine(1402)-N(4))-methyltransferase RsmH [Candidatus Andersenbacteria bacterium]